MTTIDHRAEAESLRRLARWDADTHLLAAIHDELRAIRGVATPKEPEPERPEACCGKCPPVEGGGYDCTCEGNPRCTTRQSAVSEPIASITEEFVEYLPADVGYNLRHWVGTLHITGEDCACDPERVPHVTAATGKGLKVYGLPPDEDECCDCHLAAVIERDKAVEERDRARTQIISLTGDLPADDEVVVRREDLRASLRALPGWREAEDRLRAALGGERA